MNDSYYLEYDPACITTEKLAFKILIMVSILADNNLAYRGTLNDISKELGYSGKADTRRNARIKTAILNLEAAGLIKSIKDDNIYTITLSKSAQKKVIRIARSTVRIIRETLMSEKNGFDWSYTLKVLLDIYNRFDINDRTQTELYYGQIANDLNITTKQVGNAIKQLERFNAVITEKSYSVREINGKTIIRREATNITPTAWITVPEDK